MSTSEQVTLFPDPDPSRRWLTPFCAVCQDGDLVVVWIGGAPLFRFSADSQADRRLAAALMAEAKAAPVQSILEVFDLDDATLWRDRQRLRKGGAAGVVRAKRGPKGPTKLTDPVVRRVVELLGQGVRKKAIALRLGISDFALRAALRKAGLTESEPSDGAQRLPFPEEDQEGVGAATEPASPGSDASAPSMIEDRKAGESEPDVSAGAGSTVAVGPSVSEPRMPRAAASGDADVESKEERSDGGSAEQCGASHQGPAALDARTAPSVRAATPLEAKLYAMLGLTRDGETEVVFENGTGLPFLGVLLTVPALVSTGLLEAARAVYERLQPGLYGLRATLLVVSFLALLRRPRPEHLKGTNPEALGDVLGLLRAPEVKTIRRKLAEIGRLGKAHLFAKTLAQRWLKEHKDALGVLYVDGHVRVYHGKHKLPKAHVTQMNRCKPATTDYWINDVTGDPVFVVTAPANAGLTKMLPKVLDDIDAIAPGRGGTVVFDRGGWSPGLFAEILNRTPKWQILTYRKGKIRKHKRSGFAVHCMRIDDRDVKLTLSVRNIRLQNGLKMREIAELRDDGGQTIIVSSDFDSPPVLLAYRLFERWRQENYFRYMKENFALDALVDYAVEEDDPKREVPNPAWNVLDTKLREAKAEAARLQREYGEAAASNKESDRRTMRGFKIANGHLGKALRAASAQVARLLQRRNRLPRRIQIGDVKGRGEVVKLSEERKLFTNVVKGAAYRAESTLLGLLRRHFRRSNDEGRDFLRTAVQQRGDLIVTGDLITVRLAPLSAPRYTKALQQLCNELNALSPTFPETTYRLRYEVDAPQH